MASRQPVVWAADLLVPVSPSGGQTDATRAGRDFPKANDIWNGDESTVTLAGAANEVVAFQLVLEKRAGRLASIKVDGGDIQASLFQNVPVGNEHGYFDDCLVPTDGDGDAVAAVSRRGPNVPDRKRQTFTVELYIPHGTPAGDREIPVVIDTGDEHRVTVRLKVYGFELPDKATCTADLNNYSTAPASGYKDALADRKRFARLTHAFFRRAREHRAHYHLLPYAQSGRMAWDYAPRLEGRGRSRRVADWHPFDDCWGPLLDGSAFEGVRGWDGPVEYLYLPVNANWPAYFEKYGRPGFWFEYSKVIGEIADHIAERGWMDTKFEVFFNHKTRWKYFPWDMDEIRFERDNQATIDFAKAATAAVSHQPSIQVINRIDSSWVFDKSARSEIGDCVQLWVVNRGSHSESPDEVELLRGKGQEVWFYGGAGAIAAEDRLDSLRWPWLAWGRETDGFCWWNGTQSGGSLDSVGAGTNFAIYPGSHFDLENPLPSLRLKVLHRGMQDHAYLTILTETAGRAAADKVIEQTIGCRDREDWYQRDEGSEVGGADIQDASQTAKPWNTATREAYAAARAAVAEAIENTQENS